MELVEPWSRGAIGLYIRARVTLKGALCGASMSAHKKNLSLLCAPKLLKSLSKKIKVKYL